MAKQGKTVGGEKPSDPKELAKAGRARKPVTEGENAEGLESRVVSGVAGHSNMRKDVSKTHRALEVEQATGDTFLHEHDELDPKGGKAPRREREDDDEEEDKTAGGHKAERHVEEAKADPPQDQK